MPRAHAPSLAAKLTMDGHVGQEGQACLTTRPLSSWLSSSNSCFMKRMQKRRERYIFNAEETVDNYDVGKTRASGYVSITKQGNPPSIVP